MIQGINKTANHFFASLLTQKLKLHALHDHFKKYPNRPTIWEIMEVYNKYQSLIGYNSDIDNPKPITIHSTTISNWFTNGSQILSSFYNWYPITTTSTRSTTTTATNFNYSSTACTNNSDWIKWSTSDWYISTDWYTNTNTYQTQTQSQPNQNQNVTDHQQQQQIYLPSTHSATSIITQEESILEQQ